MTDGPRSTFSQSSRTHVPVRTFLRVHADTVRPDVLYRSPEQDRSHSSQPFTPSLSLYAQSVSFSSRGSDSHIHRGFESGIVREERRGEQSRAEERRGRRQSEESIPPTGCTWSCRPGKTQCPQRKHSLVRTRPI